MTRRVSTTVLIGAIAVLVVTVTSAVIAWRASNATIAAGFWWADTPLLLSADDAVKVGGPLTADELSSIEAISRDEVRRAYAGLRIAITDQRDAFWRVAVVGAPLTVNAQPHDVSVFVCGPIARIWSARRLRIGGVRDSRA